MINHLSFGPGHEQRSDACRPEISVGGPTASEGPGVWLCGAADVVTWEIDGDQDGACDGARVLSTFICVGVPIF